MTQEQINELRNLAQAATPGPWYAEGGTTNKDVIYVYSEHSDFEVCHGDTSDSDYIAAANPAAILTLIAEIDSLRDQVNGLTGTLERVENERNNQILRNHNLMIELRESRRDNAITMGWLADCRTASGDNGDRMLPAFVEYLRDLKQRANK